MFQNILLVDIMALVREEFWSDLLITSKEGKTTIHLMHKFLVEREQ